MVKNKLELCQILAMSPESYLRPTREKKKKLKRQKQKQKRCKLLTKNLAGQVQKQLL